MAAGLRATAKAVDHPPEPKVGAPVSDPTSRGEKRRRLDTLVVTETTSLSGWTYRALGPTPALAVARVACATKPGACGTTLAGRTRRDARYWSTSGLGN